MPTIETARLILRLPTYDDTDAFDEMDADPEVMRYIGTGRTLTRTKDETAELIERIQTRWDERGFGLLAVGSRESGEVLGWVTLAEPTFLPELMPAVEIGWRFRRQYWGLGYATEAARPLLHHGFTVAGLDRILSIRQLENTASGRIMEKLGLRHTHDTVVPSHGGAVAVYALDRADYRPPAEVTDAAVRP